MRIVNGKPTTAIKQLRRLWKEQRYSEALKLAASWPNLGKDRDVIQRGWAAINHRHDYKEMGYDPDVLYADALLTLSMRYKLGKTIERS